MLEVAALLALLLLAATAQTVTAPSVVKAEAAEPETQAALVMRVAMAAYPVAAAVAAVVAPQ